MAGQPAMERWVTLVREYVWEHDREVVRRLDVPIDPSRFDTPALAALRKALVEAKTL